MPRDGRGTLTASVSLKRLAIGRPRATRELSDTLLPKFLALPIFSSDPISSIAYATEAALAVLVATSLGARHVVLPISIAIATLLAIVVVSYMQGVRAYASSGGSYVFAKEDLGTLAGLSRRRRCSPTTCSRWRFRSPPESSPFGKAVRRPDPRRAAAGRQRHRRLP